MEALKSAEGFLRAKLNNKIKVRRIPSLVFVHDTSIEYSIKISKMLDDLHEADKDE